MSRAETPKLTRIQTPGAGEKVQGPAIILSDPLHPHNLGSVVRGASCFGLDTVIFTGDRVRHRIEKERRLPREERIKGFRNVRLLHSANGRPFDLLANDVTPVSVEIRQGSENLLEFEHPPNPVYVFGPEDGHVPTAWRGLCHRHVFIPSNHCLNLAVAVNLVLFDRMRQLHSRGLLPSLSATEVFHADRGDWHPGWANDDNITVIT